MLTSQRKQLILDALKRDGQVIARTLSVEFDVSEDTIRRDLRELAAEGQLQRVHGGALPASPAAVDFAGRERIESASKAAIGRAAAGMIARGQIAFIDGGTTAVQLARHLPRDLRATIVTHSPSIAVELAEHAELEVIMIGGRLFRHSMVNVGAAAIESLSHIRADFYFMGVTGVHPQAGLSTGDMEEAYVKRALAEHAAETVVLASAEKLNAASAYKIADVSAASTIVVERNTPEVLTTPFEALGITILRA
ncbi:MULTISPECIES: DeoR/GlpR family DNA-binding transcription regulator [Paraburkholderia]|uniref:DeoR/GlpR family DNA-binding transcription regulator n=1 Tax=Paraburkholderia TaxID=1822464 RepID=UPI000B838081|nr:MULTISPECIES: DeoR/GlpR family DNA-binding transcription regulator [Paraburkholderia]MCP2091038.1 DeoR/GlpR family transcriptional regulator of sugar metabolism [Paraburkholderia sediminicola]MCX4158750.1 DeoR/GlpR family DNA-binding transcription regulator [Paraburkholderia aspalathi]MDN7168150.1 DeoR/GlpR family DNA-binding transcription regulator [Paraburkholderia sp. SECH2]MDQ6396637.1 DeoR/GlpR family DNA-binding transcription regulator [Paraburkholderia aspalathi]